MTGCITALSNGLTFTRTFIRDPYRKHLIHAVSNSFDGVSIHSTAYTHDLLSRRTNIVMTAPSGTNALACSYNARSEVTGVTIDTNEYAYIYDNIGNSLYTSLNAATNAYTVNNLNQYKDITNLVDLAGYVLDHDADGNTTLIGEHELAYDDENRLSLYLFSWEPGMTGTIQNAYIHDHLGRRVRKMGQEFRMYDPGGMTPPTYWWQTNDVTTFVYDGWNLVHESTALTNGTMQDVSYFWGKDLSGSMQGAGGVGGLLAASIDDAFYFPCYDNNGNITAYIDESGSVIAYRQYDAFGNTVSKGGAMVDTLHFWYSTKYLDHDTGLYYYGYRYYSPMLQRWINRDPIEESGGLNVYEFMVNNTLNDFDLLGMSVYWDNYPNYELYPSEQTTKVWEMVGGRLFWNHITEPLRKKPGDENTERMWLNSCALRISISLNKAEKAISAGNGIEKNFDVKADMDILVGEKSIKKGAIVKATPSDIRYVVRAANMADVLSKLDKLKKVPWKSKNEAKGLRECLEKQDKEAFFTGKGHVGMIKKGYKDPYFPFDEKGMIWIISD